MTTKIQAELAEDSDFLLQAERGAANGVAELDSGGKVPAAQLPASATGTLQYQGSWNADTNTPTLASGAGTQGHYYVVSVAGSTNLDGITDWVALDWVVYNGTAWEKVDNTQVDLTALANTWTGVQAFLNATPTVQRTGQQAVSTWNRPEVHGSGVLIGQHDYYGQASDASLRRYASQYAYVIDDTVGNEDSKVYWETYVAGSLAARFHMGAGLYSAGATGGDKGADTFNISTLYLDGTDLTTKTIDWTAGGMTWSGGYWYYTRSGNPVSPINRRTDIHGAGFIFQEAYIGQDAADADVNYAYLDVSCVDDTAAAEDGKVVWRVMVAGTLTQEYALGGGVLVGAASGGHKGVGTINASTLYLDGTNILAKASTWSGTNTWTANQVLRKSGAYGVWTIGRTDTHGDAQNVGAVAFTGKSDAAGDINYAQINCVANEDAAGSEDGRLDFYTYEGGALALRATLDNGFYMDGATGADKGAGTINATGVYINGAAVTNYSHPNHTGDVTSTGDGATVITEAGLGNKAINMQDKALSRAKITDYGVTSTAPSISSGTLTLNMVNGNDFDVTWGENITTLTVSSWAPSGSLGKLTLRLAMDGTTRTVAWPAGWKWPGGTEPTDPSINEDLFVTVWSRDAGTTIYAAEVGQAFA